MVPLQDVEVDQDGLLDEAQSKSLKH